MFGFLKARWVCCKHEVILHPDQQLNEARLLTYFSTCLQLTLSINAISEGTESRFLFPLTSLSPNYLIIETCQFQCLTSNFIMSCLPTLDKYRIVQCSMEMEESRLL
jgi:hypothetical protein